MTDGTAGVSLAEAACYGCLDIDRPGWIKSLLDVNNVDELGAQVRRGQDDGTGWVASHVVDVDVDVDNDDEQGAQVRQRHKNQKLSG